MTNIEYANSLRLIADFYEQQPDMPTQGDSIFVHTWDRAEFLKAAKSLASGGKVTKKMDDPGCSLADYHAMRTFGGITIDLRIPRKTICKLIRPAEYECPDSLLEQAAEYTEVA